MERLVTILTVLGLAIFFNLPPRVNIPSHLLHHPSLEVSNLLTESAANALLNLAKDMKEFPTNAEDTKFYKTTREHIGEAQPIGKDGSCSHPLLIPNADKTLCVLAGRADIGRHFILGGGVEGLKEPYHQLVSRLLSFGRYMFDLEQYPVVRDLFNSDIFQESSKKVCPPNKQILDPFQFNFIVQVPGQTVALHVDGVYFWGADRFHYPQWLLAVMQFSGLFQDRFIDQIQVVGYFHQWSPNNHSRHGEFVFWDDENPEAKIVKPHPRAGTIVDGSKVVHAATIYYPEVKAPLLEKSKKNVLKYVGDDKWELHSDGNLLQTYNTDQLRWTIVYRARCFESEEELQRYKSLPEESYLTIDQIMKTFKDDLIKKGKLKPDQVLSQLDFAIKLMDEYIKYPLSTNAWIPFNYCALPVLLPWTKYLVQFFC
eukprot:TRINITY_DN5818_c0_g1_i1.p1 TRINITY_DN5818_c0_g1~~TRINITY_DN5818_c0_g1_i1.p1  ORF type:complete len:427 (-),score=77.09 TRINITY_DN5818_c0_g1_i1:40-1320(-)